MKRKIWRLGLVCLLLCAMTACGGTTEKITLPEDDTPPQTQTEPPEVPATPEIPAAPEASKPEAIQPVEPAIPEPVESEEPAIPQTGRPAMLTAYAGILEELYQAYQDPEQLLYGDGPSFALYDVDLDGMEELLVQDPAGEVAGQWVRIYGYDGSAGEAYIELEEFPDLTYYDNGIIEAGWSHNQGAAGDKLWPYNVYQYDGASGMYQQIAMVDGWDKNLREILAGESFPEEVDQDGDGFIYYVITEEGGYAPVYGTAMDYAAYEAWRDSYLNGAAPGGPSFLPLAKENIETLGR